MKKIGTILIILSLCISSNVFAYTFTDAENQQIQAIQKVNEGEIAQSRNIQARSIAMQKIIDSKSDAPESKLNHILDEVYFQIWLKNNILKAWNVYCKIWEIKLIDNAEKSITDSWMKLVWVNMLCVNASRTKTADPLWFMALDLNSGKNDPIYTSFAESWVVIWNIQSHFFTDKTLLSPEFNQGAFKPMEKKSWWLIFQIDDRATRVAFWILQNLTPTFGLKTASIARKDSKYLSDSALLCRKYESLDYSSADCLLATLGTFKLWMPKYFVLDAIWDKRESCGTYKSANTLGQYESYCFKEQSQFLTDQSYYYFLNNKLIDTSSVSLK